MASLKQKDLEKLQAIQESKGEKVLANVPEEELRKIFQGVSGDMEKIDLFIKKAEEEKERVEKAKIAYAVIQETKRLMGKLNPEYQSLVERIETLKTQINNSREIVGGVTVGVVSKKSQIRENLENAEKGLRYIEKTVGDSLAKKYGFQSAMQVESLVNFSEK